MQRCVAEFLESTNLNKRRFTPTHIASRMSDKKGSGSNRMSNRRSNLVLLTAFLFLFIALTWSHPAESQIEKDARFTHATYSPRVRSQTTDTWTFTIYNANCSEDDQGTAHFFFQFFLDRDLYFDEYNTSRYKTWLCNKGQTISHSYEIRGWSATRPINREIRIELYWFCNGIAYLEDTTSFTVAVTVMIPLQHVYATGYVVAYVLAAFFLFSYNYVAGLEE